MKRQLFRNVWRNTLLYVHKQHASTNLLSLVHCQCSCNNVVNYGTVRLKSTLIASSTGHINNKQTYLEVYYPSWSEPLKLNYVWLRDHCRCNNCYNHVTKQRNFDLLKIPLDIYPHTHLIEGDELSIKWPDGHNSKYKLDWLWKNSYNGFLNSQMNDLKLWDKHSVQSQNIARVDMPDYMNTDTGIYDVVKSIKDFGVGMVINVPPAIEATEKVVLKVAHVHHTMFGGMWELSDKFVHHDTAYTHQALGAHNDNTYFTEASGLQVFHCVYHDGEGGETLLVDGFRAAHDLKQTHPESFHRLSTLPIEFEYAEPGRHYINIDSVLKLHPVTKKLEQIRFNLYDRAPMRTLKHEQISQLYQDLYILTEKIQDPTGEWWLKLQPGVVLFIDNWRVLHGRASYTGLRKLTGCYLGRADYLSKAKVLGIL